MQKTKKIALFSLFLLSLIGISMSANTQSDRITPETDTFEVKTKYMRDEINHEILRVVEKRKRNNH